MTINDENNDFCSQNEKNTIKLLLKCAPAIIAKLFFRSPNFFFKNKNKSVTSKLPEEKKNKVKFGLYVFHERQISQLDIILFKHEMLIFVMVQTSTIFD